MGAIKLRTQITTVPNSGDDWIIEIRYNGIIELTIFGTWGSTITIGATPSLCAANLKTAVDGFVSIQNAQNIVTEVIGDSLYITAGTNFITTVGKWYGTIGEETNWIENGSYTFGYVTQTTYTYPPPDPVILDEAIILSRSPYSFKASPGVAYDNITAEIYLYRGHKVDDIPTSSTFPLSKAVVQAGQLTILFNISSIANDFVKNNLNIIPSTGAFTSSELDTIWCYVDASVNLGDVSVYTIKQTVLAVDGFGWFTESANPIISQNILTTETNHIIFDGQDYPIYFKTENLTEITINGVDVPFTFNTDYNNQVIGMVNISSYIDSNENFEAIFTYGEETETLNFTVETECKYSIVNCIFKNKFGFWQSIAFNKLSKSAVSAESESYQSIVSENGEYQLNNAVFKTFGVVETETITVNTGFVDESYNSKFKELLASEFIYLVENGQTLPVNLIKKSVEKKTKLINKLIQFSMDFKYSFNSINEII